MNDFETLSAVVAGQTVKLTWNLHHLGYVGAASPQSVAIVRTLFGDDTGTIVATSIGDFAGSTYTDTVPAPGDYRYKIIIVAGIAPEFVALESNEVAVSTVFAVTLSGTVANGRASLSWTTGAGNVVETIVERSLDGGAHWFSIKAINGRLSQTYSENFPITSTPSYRVRVVLPPASCDAVGQHPVLISNAVAAAGAAVVTPVIDLGAASSFAILAGSTVTNTGGTVITGDLGLSPGTSVTGFPPGTVVGTQHVTDTAAANAQLALTAAYNLAAALPGATIIAGDQAGVTLAPGVYKSTSSLAVGAGVLTLDAGGNPNAYWVFQIASTLITSAGGSIVLANGAQAKNVFWQVGSSATIGVGSVFKGTIMANQSITFVTGASLVGRALASVAAVTLDTDPVTLP